MTEYIGEDNLRGLFEAQAKIQTLAYGKDPREITDPVERIQFIKDMHTALTMELGEMLDETGWKPWATSNHVNEEAGGKELSDVLLFFINLCFAFRVTPEMLAENTFEKMQRNLDRQLAGYDGITGKCKRCKRALDDTAVTCREDESTDTFWCGELVVHPDYHGPYGYFEKSEYV